MRRFRFVVGKGYDNKEHAIEEEFEDNVTEQEIKNYLLQFAIEYCDIYCVEL
jgi:hypothetical protein